MQPASRFMRRFWWSCLIMLGLLALAGGVGFVVARWIPVEPESVGLVGGFTKTLSWPWGVALVMVGLLGAGALLLWPGRRLKLGAALSCVLALGAALVFSGTARHFANTYAAFSWHDGRTRYTAGIGVCASAGWGSIVLYRDSRRYPAVVLTHLRAAPDITIDGTFVRDAPDPLWASQKVLPLGGWAERCGFQIISFHTPNPGTGTESYDGVNMPWWFVGLFLLVFPALYGRACWKRAYAPVGPRCSKCGYDLRGHAASDASAAASAKCPECGTPILTTAPVPPEA